jgi:hypothetical protein
MRQITEALKVIGKKPIADSKLQRQGKARTTRTVVGIPCRAIVKLLGYRVKREGKKVRRMWLCQYGNIEVYIDGRWLISANRDKIPMAVAVREAWKVLL